MVAFGSFASRRDLATSEILEIRTQARDDFVQEKLSFLMGEDGVLYALREICDPKLQCSLR